MKVLTSSLLVLIMVLIACSSSSSLVNNSQEEKNKKIAVSYIEEVVNNRNLDRLNKIFSLDYISHEMDGKEIKSIKNDHLIQFLKSLFKAFPDLHYSVIDVIAEGNMVALNLSAQGTHHNDFLGFPASGNKVQYKEMFFFRLEEHKIIEGWGVVDIDGVKKQLEK